MSRQPGPSRDELNRRVTELIGPMEPRTVVTAESGGDSKSEPSAASLAAARFLIEMDDLLSELPAQIESASTLSATGLAD